MQAEPARVSDTARTVATSEEKLIKMTAAVAELFDAIAVDLSPLLERIGDARIVLLEEATHGTSEFYRMRERVSRELIVKKGFRFITIEG
jgi:protein-L-isoaspartate(D-aspartate) O-methyltransferase